VGSVVVVGAVVVVAAVVVGAVVVVGGATSAWASAAASKAPATAQSMTVASRLRDASIRHGIGSYPSAERVIRCGTMTKTGRYRRSIRVLAPAGRRLACVQCSARENRI
jgi:hypothetical protein